MPRDRSIFHLSSVVDISTIQLYNSPVTQKTHAITMEKHMTKRLDESVKSGCPDYDRPRKRGQLIVTGVLIFLFALGMLIDEADFMGTSHTGVIRYLEVYSAFLPLLIYIVPFGIIVKKLGVEAGLSSRKLLGAAFCGAFISSALAAEINDGFDSLMKHLMGHAYSENWLGSFETGIAEELLKLATVAMLLYVWNSETLDQYMITGICTGMGFQIEEDISYITQSGFKNVNDAFPTALDRISGSVGSHWAYAAMTAVGLYMIKRTTGKGHRMKGFGLILFVIVNHFLYDTPIGEINLVNVLLTVAVVLPVLISLDEKRDRSVFHLFIGEGI